MPRRCSSTAPSSAAGAIGSPIAAPDGLRWTYADLLAHANRIARVLTEDLGLVPGNRVLLRAPNSPHACGVLVRRAEGGRHRGRHDAAVAGQGAHRHRHQGTDFACALRPPPRRRARGGPSGLSRCSKPWRRSARRRPTASTRSLQRSRRRSPTSIRRPTTRRSSRSPRARRASRKERCTFTAT